MSPADVARWPNPTFVEAARQMDRLKAMEQLEMIRVLKPMFNAGMPTIWVKRLRDTGVESLYEQLREQAQFPNPLNTIRDSEQDVRGKFGLMRSLLGS